MAGNSAVMEFGDKLRERREQVKMDQAALAGRLRISTDELNEWEQGKNVDELPFGRILELAEALDTTVDQLAPAAPDDRKNGVLVQLPEQRAVLKGVRDGLDYYVYNCLVRTRAVPSLVPLVVDVLVDDPAQAKFNDGHAGNEFIYVLSGTIHMKWGDPDAPDEAILPEGASLYIEPYVRHSFTAADGTGPARLLAVNF